MSKKIKRITIFFFLSFFLCFSSSVQAKESLPVVAIFVDENLYLQIQSELEVYKQDIENDLNANVLILNSTWDQAEKVRNELIDINSDRELLGSVLIGDVATSYFETLSECNKTFASDRYFMDLNDDAVFVDEDNNGKFEWKEYSIDLKERIVENGLPDFVWTGRIKLPEEDNIQLLKDYFERVHKYKMGELEIPRRMYIYSMHIDRHPDEITPPPEQVAPDPTPENIEIYRESVRRIFHLKNDLFEINPEEKIKIEVNLSPEDFFKDLEKEYEFVRIVAHGTTTYHEFKNKAVVNGEDVKKAEPKGYFYFLLSCGAGDFSKEKYLDGYYLFHGNGLVLLGYTGITRGAADGCSRHLEQLEKGKLFGELLTEEIKFHYNFTPGFTDPEMAAYSKPVDTVLGDPTLRIKEGEDSRAKVNAKIAEIENWISRLRTQLRNLKKPGEEADKGYFYWAQDKLEEISGWIYDVQSRMKKLEKKKLFKTNLEYGDEGQEVKKLQNFFIRKGFLPGGFNTGQFDLMTEKAVIEFQEKYASEVLSPWGLTEGTGYVGETTRRKLNEIYNYNQ